MYKNIIRQSALAASLLVLMAACNDADSFDYNANVAYISGTEVSPITKFVVEDTPTSHIVVVSTAKPVDKDVKVTLAIDASKVDEYNTANSTSFFAIPSNCVTLEQTQVTIPAGRTYSDGATVKVISTEGFEEGRTYLIPVTIKSCDGVDVLTASGTIFLQIARILHFNALDLSPYQMYSNYIFTDDKRRELTSFTLEVKCYINQLRGTGNISRMIQFCGPNEETSMMFRFDENDLPNHSLNWSNGITGSPKMGTNTQFDTGKWYMLSMTYDGTTFTQYVDGVRDYDRSDGDGSPMIFQRMELGMSWGGYQNSQRFNGSICEIRVWDRALSPVEIQVNTCGADPKDPNLVAYWKMNEGEGHIFHDATGHGYDMDWSDTWRDDRENGVLVAHDYSSYVRWNTSDTNKCAQ